MLDQLNSHDPLQHTELEPLTLEETASALGLQMTSVHTKKQRDALRLEQVDVPAWCHDRRVVFFSASSVKASAEYLNYSRERLRRARRGELPQSWASFKPIAREPVQKSSKLPPEK